MFNYTPTASLARLVEKHIRANDVPASRFGRQAIGDPRFVYDLRKGREPRPVTVKRVMAYLEATQAA